MMNFVKNQFPLFFWMILIYWLSSIQRIPVVYTPIIPADKIAHLTIFFVLCWFSWRAFYFQETFLWMKRYALLLAFLFTCFYGYVDEVHQLFVPGRTYDYLDMLADATGALMFISGYMLLFRLKIVKKIRVDNV